MMKSFEDESTVCLQVLPFSRLKGIGVSKEVSHNVKPLMILALSLRVYPLHIFKAICPKNNQGRQNPT